MLTHNLESTLDRNPHHISSFPFVKPCARRQSDLVIDLHRALSTSYKTIHNMAPPDTTAIAELLTKGPFRVDIGRKQLTLAFAELYLAATTDAAKPKLVWEIEKGYPRYYVPLDSLHQNIKALFSTTEWQNGETECATIGAKVEHIDTVNGKGNDAAADIERLTIGDKSTTWVRFTSGQFKDHIRFERSEIGSWACRPLS